MSVEAWKSLFDVAAVVLLFLTFAAGAGVLITGNVVNKRQEEKLRKFDGDITRAKSDLTLQVGHVAVLQKEASDARAAQQQVGIELEKQRQRTAEAEKTLLALTKRQGNRHISEHSVRVSLQGKPAGRVIIWYQPNDPEAYWFSFQIMGELMSAGWIASQPVPVPDNISVVEFLGPEYQTDRDKIDRFMRSVPPAVRIAGGNGELTLMSKKCAK